MRILRLMYECTRHFIHDVLFLFTLTERNAVLKMTLIMGFLYCKSDLSLCNFRFLTDLYQRQC